MGRTARGGNGVNIAAVYPFVAHESADEGDRFAVWRPAGHRYLHGRLHDRFHLTRRQRQGVELSDIPVIVAGAMRGDSGETLTVGRPVILINVEVGQRELLDTPG